MCGRYNFMSDQAEFEREFGAVVTFDWHPRFNIAPSQEIPIIVLEDGHRVARLASWGFLPGWARDPNGRRPINARSETAATNGMFRGAFRARRCLVPATGWFEWQKTERGKIPYLIRPVEGPAAFAGLWERWGEGDDGILTCAILTTDAAPEVRHIHDRMPVVLGADVWDRWLGGTVEDAERILGPYTGGLEWYAVSRAVNSPANDSPVCVQPVDRES